MICDIITEPPFLGLYATYCHPQAFANQSILRANTKIMAFTLVVASLAAFNALCVPLALEHEIRSHASTDPIYAAGEIGSVLGIIQDVNFFPSCF